MSKSLLIPKKSTLKNVEKMSSNIAQALDFSGYCILFKEKDKRKVIELPPDMCDLVFETDSGDRLRISDFNKMHLCVN